MSAARILVRVLWMAMALAAVPLAAQTPSSHPDSDRHYERGKALREQGALAEARSEFEQAIALYPYAVWAMAEHGRANLAMGNVADARQDLERARALEAELSDISLRAASNQSDLSADERAAIMDRRMEGLVRFRSAEILFRLEAEYDAATGDVAAVAARCREDDVQNIVLTSLLPTMAGSTDATEQAWGMWLMQTWVDACPTDWNMRRALGKTLIHMGNYEAAGPHLAAVQRNDPGRFGLIESEDENDLIALYQSRQYPEALQLARQFSRSWPLALAGPYIGSRAAFYLDRYREQLALDVRSAELDPGPVDAYTLELSGIAHAVLGDYAAARSALDRSVALDPAAVEARKWRIVAIYAAAGKGQAIQAGRSEQNPMSEFEVLEISYYGTLDFAERAERSGNSYAALANYALALRALQDFVATSQVGTTWAINEEANLSAKVLAIYRGMPAKPVIAPAARPFIREAEAAAQRKDSLAAAAAYQKAVEQSPWTAQLRYNHALALAGRFLNNLPWAVSEMQRFIALAPGDRRVAQGQAKIAQWQSMIERTSRACQGRVGYDLMRTKGVVAPQLLLQPLESC